MSRTVMGSAFEGLPEDSSARTHPPDPTPPPGPHFSDSNAINLGTLASQSSSNSLLLIPHTQVVSKFQSALHPSERPHCQEDLITAHLFSGLPDPGHSLAIHPAHTHAPC